MVVAVKKNGLNVRRYDSFGAALLKLLQTVFGSSLADTLIGCLESTLRQFPRELDLIIRNEGEHKT